MFSCRAVWQRCGPLARRAAYRLPLEGVQRRAMSSVPGGSGENILYTVLCGGALVGALSYAYVTVTSDHERFNERISEIRARPKTEWTPKPWPPKGGDADEDGEAEAGEEEAAAAEAETIVEEAAEVVAEAAEAVAEAAEAVAEVAQEVEAAAEEVTKVAEAVEEAAQAVAEPAAVGAEETQSDVPLAAASALELLKKAEEKDDSAPTEQEPLLSVVEKETPAVAEVSASDGSTLGMAVPVIEENVSPVEDGKASETEAPTKQSPAPAEVLSEEELPAFLQLAPVVEKPSVQVPLVEEATAPVDIKPVEEGPAPIQEVPLPLEAAPVADEPLAPAEVAKEAPAPTEVEIVVEEPPAPVDASVLVEEAPAPVEVAAVVEEAPAPVEVAAVVEEAPAPVEVAAVVEEAPAPAEVAAVVEEAPAPAEVAAVVEEAPAPAEVAAVVEEAPAEVAAVVEEAPAPAEVAAVMQETPALVHNASKEYIVVVLEGTPKEEKRPKVLGVGPMTGRIILDPEDDSTPASEGRRRLLRMQMQ
ncbi:uncharacterized protein mgarpa isoform 3-T3 [Fundulus diaphanus]